MSPNQKHSSHYSCLVSSLLRPGMHVTGGRRGVSKGANFRRDIYRTHISKTTEQERPLRDVQQASSRAQLKTRHFLPNGARMETLAPPPPYSPMAVASRQPGQLGLGLRQSLVRLPLW